MMDNFELARTLKYLPGIIIGLTIHEFSHAYTAKLCGDNTASEQGRVTLNPLKHIDPLGFIMLLIAGFGWAKPVQFNEEKLRNSKADVIKIALSGPLSNAITAVVLSVVFVLTAGRDIGYPGAVMSNVYEMLIYSVYINWGLFVFNLIPIPPLDGSHLLLQTFRNHPTVYDWLYKYGTFLLFGILIAGSVTGKDLLPIGPLVQFLAESVISLLG